MSYSSPLIFEQNEELLPLIFGKSDDFLVLIFGKMDRQQKLKEKNKPTVIRFSLENFAAYDQILVFPLYIVSNLLNE